MINDLEFEKQIEKFSESEKFLARQLYAVQTRCVPCATQLTEHEERLDILEGRKTSTKQLLTNSAGGGITGAIVGGVIAMIEYFRTMS